MGISTFPPVSTATASTFSATTIDISGYQVKRKTALTLAPGVYKLTTSPTTGQCKITLIDSTATTSFATFTSSSSIVQFNVTETSTTQYLELTTSGANTTAVTIEKIAATGNQTAISNGTLDTVTNTSTYNATGWLYVLAVGGGGGGAGAGATAGGVSIASGGGGGASGGSSTVLTYTTAAQTVTIGTAGNGGNGSTGNHNSGNGNGNSGNAGGSTTFGNLVTGLGGTAGPYSCYDGGTTASAVSGGGRGGGSFANDDSNVIAKAATINWQSISNLTNSNFGGGGGGNFQREQVFYNNTSTINGAGSGIGAGGNGGTTNSINTSGGNGNAANGYGSGGGGGGAGAFTRTGGNGAAGSPGIVYVLRGF
jgi:hypothetical protein